MKYPNKESDCSELIFKIKVKTKINKDDLESVSITLLAIVGIMQASELFFTCVRLSDILKYLILLLSLAVIFLQFRERNITSRNMIWMMFIACIIAYTCISIDNFSFQLICLFLLTGKSTSIDNFVRRSLKVLIILGGGHILLWVVNYIIPFGLTVYTNEYERRIAFGFTHPNIFSIKFGWGIIMYLWLNWECMTKRKWILLYALSLIFYIATKSDSWLIIFGILMLSVCRKIKFITRFVSAFSYVSFPILGLMNIYVATRYLVNGKLTNYSIILDIFFNRRISMGYLAIKENGITLFGQKIEMNHNWDRIFNYNGYTIDSTYVYLFACLGIVYFILISMGFFQLRKYNSYKAALVILSFSLFSLIEVHGIYLTNSFALLLLKTVFFRENKIE